MTESAPEVEREIVPGQCPRCQAADLARYDAVSESGWVRVTKCQSCLFSLERTPANRLGPITLLVDLV
ncbi:hypothetical protein [Gordonia rhizosphera]|uniref:Uncharacterized protein n=1 Tax=Gordonia rhizosphera NBRC 16068 TaxID=1108045 RepID=K6WXH3_9ACTN|nr:hypothetical protein [Gordonia rhizosphera]GAB91249.1 hypothetical protein GORHZ_125_01330 [Gordonia rhizosphera NBRC 16068]